MDVKGYTWWSKPFVWMGKNAIIMYILAESGITQWFIGAFYIDGKPGNNLVEVLWPSESIWGLHDEFSDNSEHVRQAVLAWTFGYIAF